MSETGHDAQMAAIRTRVTQPVPEPDEDAWAAMLELLDSPVVRNLLPLVSEMPFKEWVARFPTKQALPLREAWDRYCRGQWTIHELFKRATFVKVEVKLNEPFDEVKPRNITSCPPLLKVILGPWCVSAMKALARAGGCREALFFECGASATEVAEWLHHWRSVLGDESAFENDFSKFDATYSKLTFDWLRAVFVKLGASAAALLGFDTAFGKAKTKRVRTAEGWVKKKYYRISGKTRCGIKFSREPMMCSGVPYTTLGNSLTNMFATICPLIAAGAKPGTDFAVMVRGDDMFAFIRPQYQPVVLPFLRKLGFSPKAKIGHPIHRWRFCSNAFYPAMTENGVRYVPAPTMKCLIKCFVTHALISTKPSALLAHIRGVAMGLRSLVAHVPLLSHLMENVIAHTKLTNAKEFKRALAQSKLKNLRSDHAYKPLGVLSDTFVMQMYNISGRMFSVVRNWAQNVPLAPRLWLRWGGGCAWLALFARIVGQVENG